MYTLSQKSIKKLNNALDLPGTGGEEHWDTELADHTRVGEFVAFYEKEDLDDDDRRALAALIFASVHFGPLANNADVREKLAEIIKRDASVLEPVLSYWKGDGSRLYMETPTTAFRLKDTQIIIEQKLAVYREGPGGDAVQETCLVPLGGGVYALVRQSGTRILPDPDFDVTTFIYKNGEMSHVQAYTTGSLREQLSAGGAIDGDEEGAYLICGEDRCIGRVILDGSRTEVNMPVREMSYKDVASLQGFEDFEINEQ